MKVIISRKYSLRKLEWWNESWYLSDYLQHKLHVLTNKPIFLPLFLIPDNGWSHSGWRARAQEGGLIFPYQHGQEHCCLFWRFLQVFKFVRHRHECKRPGQQGMANTEGHYLDNRAAESLRKTTNRETSLPKTTPPFAWHEQNNSSVVFQPSFRIFLLYEQYPSEIKQQTILWTN